MEKELSELALIAMCEKCVNHEICKGTGCSDKKTLQKLVSKDVPAKVIFERKVGYISGHIIDLPICPSCGIIFSKEVEQNQFEYCPKCGQKLDWSVSCDK